MTCFLVLLLQVLDGLAKLIRECWHKNANVRLPALRVKKTIQKLASTSTKMTNFVNNNEDFV